MCKNKYIVVNLTMFNKDNSVFIVDPTQPFNEQVGTFSVEEMPTVLTELAREQDIYDIRILGNSKYAQLVEFGVNMAEVQRYGNKKIRIEVIN